MNKRVATVLKGVMELSLAERQEFLKSLNDLLSEDTAKQRVLNEEIAKTYVTLGPAPQPCPCCGR